MAQLKAAAANSAATKALKVSLVTLADAASADYAAVVAAGASDVASLKAAAVRLQADLGAILASPAG